MYSKLYASFLLNLFGLFFVRANLYSEELQSTIQLEQCHNGCIKRYSTDDISCLQAPECSMCWDECTTSTSINKSILSTWTLSVTSMVRDNSLVSSNIAWKTSSSNSPKDCLVTWEVAGGGLIGNLLTQSSSVELSLWPDTKYRIQVTCKDKHSEEISRSLPLTLDTSNAIVMVHTPSTTSSMPILQSIPSSLSPSLYPSQSSSSSYEPTLSPALTADIPEQSTNNIEEQLFEHMKYNPSIVMNNNHNYDFNDDYSISVFSIFELRNRKAMLISLTSLMFIVIVIYSIAFAAFINKRKSRTLDKTPLVDNEVSVNVDVERLTIHV